MKHETSALLSIAALSLLISGGCGDDGPTTIPVSGKITFGGGPPPAEGAIYFAPLKVDEGYPRRPGRARFGQDGNYAATSFETGDGLVPGEYRVSVESWKSPPGMGSAGGVSYVGLGFEPPNLVVPADESRVKFDLEVPLGP